ncbi:Glutamine--scyllo-inositol transaminase [Beutenbergia cavernae DSM 12333]|uniref:Glutamine--scyllo-inositol transaminase n=1 Tax=Beutenbergia cavernae (strain ATCC BAA-8 / DSM 12333 / CCUG 43141 / JCM 11478 / NBRC 16432 / NCIMB 13614 / HKI 0122) TaxID=471853 RepID=C5C1H9_BEUC1|nr:DegT/DnrJ/EryC1/StrS family aminotransferase [Beutenbergia cavernae]ACQ81589.1 Glutamine--scyllo-inositol transaminase [Beutenbergia cavernae DSM 12333]
MSDVLALDGGAPVRTAPFPSVSSPAGRTLGVEEERAVVDVVRSGQLNSTVGGVTRGFEQDFARYYGVPHAVASGSGTSAIHLAVAAVDPEPGDEIITTGLSDAGTVLPILAQNAVPVFADVDPATGNLDVESVRARITSRTRAIIAVHLFGQPAPVVELRALADDHGIVLIEDCAQAYLTAVSPDGALAGTVGHLGCFSLQQSKHITAGDGGLTITSDDALARRARLFADKAWPRDTDERTHLFLGLNYRMTELQAAVARVQLTKLAGVVEDRRRSAKALTDVVTGLAGLTAAASEGMSYWQFPVFIDPDVAGADAHWYARALAAEGIPASGGYIQRPLYLTPVFTERRTYGSSGYPLSVPPADSVPEYAPGLCPVTEELIGARLLVIAWNEKYTSDDVADIAAALEKVHASRA